MTEGWTALERQESPLGPGVCEDGSERHEQERAAVPRAELQGPSAAPQGPCTQPRSPAPRD